MEKMAQAIKLEVPKETERGAGFVVNVSYYSGETVSYPITTLASNKLRYSFHVFQETFHYL